jgi:pimeloyl-ACP methyl ester carboxylesterase
VNRAARSRLASKAHGTSEKLARAFVAFAPRVARVDASEAAASRGDNMNIERRTALGIMAAAGLAACGTEVTRREAPFVLVHGAWHGAWCWERVAPQLQAQQHAVHTPTLAGLGERAAELSARIDLETHIGEVVQYIEQRNLREVVLVGHSYAGLVISGVADRLGAARLRRLVYLDALVLDSGQSLASFLGPAWTRFADAAREKGGGIGVPALPPAAFGVLDPQDQAWVASRLTAQPVHTFDRPLMLREPLGNGVPKIYIDCHSPGMPAVAPFKAKVRAQKGWAAYESLATGHDAMVTEPSGLAQLLLKHAA